MIADRDATRLGELAVELGDQVLAVPGDVTDSAALEDLATQTYDLFGQVDLLFCNAGVLNTGLSWEISAENWRRVLDVNVLGVINTLRAFVPRLIASQRPARIVITSSIGGFLTTPLLGPYSASKFALVAIAETLAGELKMLESLVQVSLLAPGAVKTQIFREPPTTASGAFHNQMLMQTEASGLSPEALAERVFTAIDRGDYWIFPQPESFDAGFAARNAIIAGRKPPEFHQIKEDL